MKITLVSREITESLMKRPAVMSEGYDQAVVDALEKLNIGDGFDVEPAEGITERSTKRRLNTMAKVAKKTLGWRTRNGKLFAFVEANEAKTVAEAEKASPEPATKSSHSGKAA